MNKSIGYIWLIIAAVWSCDPVTVNTPEPEDFFVKLYGSAGGETANDFIALADGFILFGTTTSPELKTNGNSGFDSDFYLVRTDEKGNEQWHFTYGIDSLDEVASRIIRTNTGDFVMVGTTELRFGTGAVVQSKVIMVRVDAGGGNPVVTVLNNDTDFNERGNDIIQSSDGNLVITGSTGNVDTLKDEFNPAIDTDDFLLTKVDPNFDLIWQQVFGFGGKDEGVSVLETDSGFAYIGKAEEFVGSSASTRVVFVPTNEIGISRGSDFLQASETTTNDFVARMRRISTDIILATGYSEATSGNRAFIIRLDARTGQQRAFRLLNIPNDAVEQEILNSRGADISFTSSGEIAVVGLLESFSQGTNPRGAQIFLARTDGFGNLIENSLRDYGGPEDDFGTAITELIDSKLMLLGTNDFEGGSTLMTLIKTDNEGNL